MTNSKRILLIEDNAEMAENISGILKLVNYNVQSAVNGRVGVEIAKETFPDLIICDIMMPELDGFGVLHILSQDARLANTPFIFLTAKTDPTDLRNGMNLGADDYITKPFHGLDLLRVIEVRLKKRALIKEGASNNGSDDPDGRLNGHGHLDVDSLTIQKHRRLFRRKELVFLEGQSAYDLYYIIRGEVKTYKVNYEGKELITGFFHAGDFIGYIPLIEGKPHHESAEVMEDTVIAVIPKHEFLDLIYSSKSIAKKFIGLLSTSLVETECRLLDIAYQSVRQRVAGALLKMNNQPRLNGGPIIITATRKDISSLIGTATESLNRTLADFKEEGLIEIREDGIRIVEKAKLERNCKQPSFPGLRFGDYQE